MNDAEYKAEKTRVEFYLIRLKDLFLPDWRVKYIFHRDYYERDRERLADITVLWEYKAATMHIYVPATAEFAANDNEYLANAIIHEFVHCMVDPISPDDPNDEQRKLVELVTETVTINMQRLFDKPRNFLFYDPNEKPKKPKK